MTVVLARRRDEKAFLKAQEVFSAWYNHPGFGLFPEASFPHPQLEFLPRLRVSSCSEESAILVHRMAQAAVRRMDWNGRGWSTALLGRGCSCPGRSDGGLDQRGDDGVKRSEGCRDTV